MKHLFTSTIFSVCLLITLNVQAQFQYTSPVPGSKYHNRTTSIILRSASPIDGASLVNPKLISVVGSISGEHESSIKLLEQGKTIVIKPVKSFAFDETVTVIVGEGIKGTEGKSIRGTSFNFEISRKRTDEENQRIAEQMKQLHDEEFVNSEASLRGGLPEIDILTNTNPAPGQVFFSHFNYFNGGDSHYCIIESNGDSVYGKFDTINYNNFDLNLNGYFTVYNEKDSSFIMLDSNFVQIGAFQTEGYKADVHEFVIFPDGNHYMLAYDPQIVDMTVYNSNYQPDATVVGCIIQELDAQNNVLFEWRTWDHYSILDGDHISYGNSLIDFCHANSIFLDTDGNLLFSCRNMSEVTKINRTTGDIMWRWGGLHNEFTFINDANKFSYQHDVLRIDNGHITMFDNGNYHTPSKTWAKEYLLDEVNKTATLTWSYKRSITGGDVYSKAMGSVQRLPNGNTFICWGLVNGQPAAPSITEIDSLGNVVWEMELSDADAIYRSHRFVWDPCARPTTKKLKAQEITANSAKLKWNEVSGAALYKVQWKKHADAIWKTKTIYAPDHKWNMHGLDANTKYDWQIATWCDLNGTKHSNYSPVRKFTTLPLRMDLSNDVSIEVFPNPAHDVLNIQSSASINEVRVYNLMGQLVNSITLNEENSDSDLQIPVSQLSSGNYLVEIITNGKTQVKKVVVE